MRAHCLQTVSERKCKKSARDIHTFCKFGLADCSDGKKGLKIDVLIGENFYYSFISNTVIRGKSGPVARMSTLGWNLGGGDSLNGNQSNCTVTHTLSVSSVNDNAYDCEDDICEELRKVWTVDAFGYLYLRFHSCRLSTARPNCS